MNWDQIEGNWKQFTGKAREQWGDLTDDEVQQAKGNREQLAGVIQKRKPRALLPLPRKRRSVRSTTGSAPSDRPVSLRHIRQTGSFGAPFCCLPQ